MRVPTPNHAPARPGCDPGTLCPSCHASTELLMTVEDSGRLSAWRWPDKTKVWTTAVIADGYPGASPDGVFVAVPAQRRVALLGTLRRI